MVTLDLCTCHATVRTQVIILKTKGYGLSSFRKQRQARVI